VREREREREESPEYAIPTINFNGILNREVERGIPRTIAFISHFLKMLITFLKVE
jgi:hypothetical protein